MRELWRRLAVLFRWQRTQEDLDEELQFHLEMKRRDTGDMTAAQRSLGSPIRWRERARDAWGWRWLDELWWDLRYTCRRFRQSPGFTAVAVSMLAVGIGINTAVFTLADTVLFKGFPFIDRNDRILYIHTQNPRLWQRCFRSSRVSRFSWHRPVSTPSSPTWSAGAPRR